LHDRNRLLENPTMILGQLFGFLHPALVHFPLALLLVSFTLEAIGFFRRDTRFAWAAQITLALGTVAMLFTFVAGNFAEIWAARAGIPQEPMEQHELLATITSWLFVFLAAGRLFLGVNARRRWMAIYLAIALCGCVLLGLTGHRGAMLVYQRGAGVQTGGSPPLPTHEDLAVLRQKQDPDALYYSNQMHHIFGGMVLLLSGMLLLDLVSPGIGQRLRRVGPLLLLAGGIFLMIYSDTDSWPLSSQRPLTDKEVLMHKTYALLMLIVGARGLGRKRGAEAPGHPLQSRWMAVFALVGGALLFTHVHSNAPYANVAVGVYLHHTVMGGIALAIGAVKLSENTLQGTAPQRRLRGLAWTYACLMLLEAVFLLNYNEGLPWFLGYRHLSLSAPHQGLIAPLGRDRAELTYDPATTRLDVYTLGQSDDRSCGDGRDTLQAVVHVGTEATVVPLRCVLGADGGVHWTGTASFLRAEPLFQAQVSASHPGGPTEVADFEPWVDPRMLSGASNHAAYVCPMHPALGAGSPGRCAVCGMALVPNRPARPWNLLHDARYALDLQFSTVSPPAPASHLLPGPSTPNATGDPASDATSAVAQPLPGQKIRLSLTPHSADGHVLKDLEVVHTKKLHLIVVAEDLSSFDHVHPQPQPDGALILDYTFPRPGRYLLFADLTPRGDRNQVFRLPVSVAGTPPPPSPLIETPVPAQVVGDYRIALRTTPDPPQAGEETALAFTLSENGKPVTDLEPFLGAGGHCVILSQDTRGYLHAHPTQMGELRFGPTLTFHTLFPRRGLYKVWAQFRHHQQPLTVSFVLRVD
jgi:uncharacterized membrane protein